MSKHNPKQKAPPTHLQVRVLRAFWIHDREAQPGDVLTFPRGFARELIAWGKAEAYSGPPIVQTGKVRPIKASPAEVERIKELI